MHSYSSFYNIQQSSLNYTLLFKHTPTNVIYSVISLHFKHTPTAVIYSVISHFLSPQLTQTVT